VPERTLAEEHYKDLSSKPFFPDLIDYITSGPVVCMVRCLKDGETCPLAKFITAGHLAASASSTTDCASCDNCQPYQWQAMLYSRGSCATSPCMLPTRSAPLG